MYKLNKDLCYKYIKIYESFNKEIPKELKDVFDKVRKIIGEPKESFNKEIDLSDFNFVDLRVTIKVNFNKLDNNIRYEDKDIIYYSNINIYDLLNNSVVDIPINISDIEISIDKLISVISHEIRHIYDFYTISEESDLKSFVNSLYYSVLYKSEKNKIFINFLELVYLSLEHELVARNTMIWEMFRYSKVSKQKLYELYHNTYMYKSLIMLDNFNYDDLIKISDIKEKVNVFINYFGGEICKNNEDVIDFFSGWMKYFKIKSKEYKKESYKVLDDILSINERNNNLYKDKEVRNVKDILLDIYNNYIKKK